MEDILVRQIEPEEVYKVAFFISTGYFDDIFFKWVVDNDEHRLKIVANYYKVYLNTKGCIACITETPSKEILGACVWLPHDVSPNIYDEIDAATGTYAEKFRAVSEKSHYSEPPMAPFYQLVGVVVDKKVRGKGIGAGLLNHQLEKFDKLGIPTYLEASTPYSGGGVYGKFGYQPVGELMIFSKNAVLYPLWRPAPKHLNIRFGPHDWLVLETRDDKMLLLSQKIIELGKYHDAYEGITWANSTIRKYLNGCFLDSFGQPEKSRILETSIENNNNPWCCTNGGLPTSDNIFLLSLEETIKYFGDSGQLSNPIDKYFIDDAFNASRKATTPSNLPARWFLRTPGNSADFVSVVTNDGKICVTGDFACRASTELFSVGIRPAMWIKKNEACS